MRVSTLTFAAALLSSLAAGGFHLTEYVPQLEELFENKTHLLWYRSTDECLDLIRYYIKRPAARAQIAAQGQDYTRRHFGMRRQVTKILEMMAAL